ncbi:hypothetical protein D3C79_557220 [compost metagenome]
MLGQAPQVLHQPLPRQAVDGLQAAVGIPGQQVVGLAFDVTRCAMGAHHPVALGTVHEEGVFDLAGRLLDQLADQVLAAPIVRRLQGRHIDHAQQLAQRVEHRRRCAGQADEGGAKVIALVHRDRGLAGQHRRHTACALLALRPAGPQIQPGLATVVADGRLDPVIDGAPLGIGKQHAVVSAAHPFVQARHGIAGDAQEQLGAFAAFVEQALGKDPRPLLGTGVEAVHIHGAAP